MNPPIQTSFKKETFFSVQCAGCGEMFITGDNEYDLFISKKQAKENVAEMDWKIKGNKAYCPECQ